MQAVGVHSSDLTIGALVERNAARAPGSLALLAPGRAAMTWGRLDEQVEQAVAALNQLGFGRGDRIALALPNGPEATAALLAIAAGAGCAPMNPTYTASELEAYLVAVGARAVVVPAGVDAAARIAARKLGVAVIELVPSLEDEAGAFQLIGKRIPRARQTGRAAPDDVAYVMHTSGTTARPKVVPLTHANVCFGAFHTHAFLELSPRDRCLNVMPLYHLHAIAGALLSSMYAGAAVICAPAFIAPKFFDWAIETEPTWYTAVPTMHQAILAQAHRHPEQAARLALRVVRSTSSALPVAVLEELETVFRAPVIEAYAMTEISQISSNPLPPRQRKPGSVGIPAGTEIAIMDDRGRMLLPGEPGEVVARGANLTRGYDGDPEATRAAFCDGWLRTGDLGYLDADGYLFISGKIKEVISRAGEKISPREIEEALLAHPAVAEAVAFAVPDELLGEDVGAAVVLAAGARASDVELSDAVAARLATFKVPRHLRIVPELPKGPTGKLQRIGLAARLGIGADATRATAELATATDREDELEAVLSAIWVEILDVAEVKPDDNFFELGGDSILAVMVLARIAEVRGIELPFRVFLEAPTLRELAARLGRATPATSATPGATAALPVVDRSRPSPVTPDQERLIHMHLGMPTNRFITWCVLSGPLKLDAFHRALACMVERHELLRARFVFGPGSEIRQQIEPSIEVALPVRDLRRAPADAQAAAFARVVADETRHTFDMTRAPLWRLTLIRRRDDDHVLVVNINHAINDNWSKSVLFHELMAAYDAIVARRAPALPELPVKYLEFAAWHLARLAADDMSGKLAWWKDRLQTGDPIRHYNRPGAEPRREGLSDGALAYWGLPAGTIKELRAACARHQVSFFMLVQAVFCALWTERAGGRPGDDLQYSVMTSIFKDRPELMNLFGPCSTSIVMRVPLRGANTLRGMVEAVRDSNLQAADHLVPIRTLLDAKCGPSQPAQVNFSYMNGPYGAVSTGGGVTLDWKFESPFETVPSFNLELQFRLRDLDNGDFASCVFYRTDRLPQAEVAELIDDMRRTLTMVAQAPEHYLDVAVAEIRKAVARG